MGGVGVERKWSPVKTSGRSGKRRSGTGDGRGSLVRTLISNGWRSGTQEVLYFVKGVGEVGGER